MSSHLTIIFFFFKRWMFVEITNTVELNSLIDDPEPPHENIKGMYISEILPCNVCLLHTVALSLLNYLNQYCCVNIIYLLEQKQNTCPLDLPCTSVETCIYFELMIILIVLLILIQTTLHIICQSN